MTIAALKTAANPAAVLITFAAFAFIIGVFYLVKNWRKVRRWWRRTTRNKHFWGFVWGVGVFIFFSAYFIFLDIHY